MDHTAYLGHQRQQQISACEILCGDQGGGQDPDQSCYSNLAGTREGPMSKQGAQDQKASSMFLRRPESHQIQVTIISFQDLNTLPK